MKGKPLVSIVSAGLSKFGKLEGLYAREIFAEAVKEAFDHCPNETLKRIFRRCLLGIWGNPTSIRGIRAQRWLGRFVAYIGNESGSRLFITGASYKY